MIAAVMGQNRLLYCGCFKSQTLYFLNTEAPNFISFGAVFPCGL
jgi:hypothetical protein